MRLPLTPPGGPLGYAYQSYNQLLNDPIDRDFKRAQSASKLAYSNLMGPQFLAKMAENSNLLANLPDDQKNATLQKIYSSGMSPFGITGNMLQSSNTQPSLFDIALQHLLGVNSNQNSGQNQQLPQSQNALNNPISTQSTPNAMAAPVQMPQSNNALQNPMPQMAPPVPAQQNAINNPNPQTFAEKAGGFKGVISEGEEAGKIRAKNIEDFGDQYEAAQNRGVAYDRLINLVNSPTFNTMRDTIPFFQGLQLKTLSKIGDKDQQKAIGNFMTSSQELVKDTINSFQGTKMKGELETAKNMKVSDDDTIGVMIGKLQAGNMFNQFSKQRASMAAKIMREQHVDKQAALEIADKQLHGDAMRNKINSMIENNKNKTTPNKIWVLYNPTGKPVGRGPEDKINKFLKDHRGYYRKES